MADYTKPLPVPDIDTRPYWEACRAHELRAPRCSQCGRFRWPPQTFCPSCYSWDYAWASLPTTGTVYTFVVPHHVAVASFKEDVPYVIANVTVDGTDDHVRLLSNVVGCPWESVRIGTPVEVFFDDVTSEVSLPKFRPRTTAS